MRRLLYSPKGIDEKTGEMKFTRFLDSSGYPRFHLFIKESGNELIFSLHLDQKKPSYKGVPAHSGEYEGKIVEQEAERIKSIISYE